MKIKKQKTEKSVKNILKTRQIFKKERLNVFTAEINRVALSSKDVKIMQLIDLIETYASGTSKGLVSKTGEIKCNNIIK